MNEPIRLRYANQIVGIFLMIVFIIGCVVSVRLFTRIAVKKDRFYVDVPEEVAHQLRTGTEVIILGETVGEVDALRYIDDSNAVRVTLEIDSKRSDLITTDSEVDLDRKYGVGPPVVRIRRNRPTDRTEPAEQILPGEVIGRFREDEDTVEDMAGKIETAGESVDVAAKSITNSLSETIDPAFQTSQQAFDSVRETSDTVRPEAVETLTQLRRTTENLEGEITQLTRRVDALVQDQVSKAVSQINDSAVAASEAAASVQKLAEGLDSKSEQTNEDIAETLKTIRETARMIQQLTQETREIVRIVRNEAEDLPGTTARVNDTVNETQDLVGDIRDHWLLRRYRTGKKPTEQVPPSSLRGGVR